MERAEPLPRRLGTMIWIGVFGLSACVTDIPPLAELDQPHQVTGGMVVGRVLAVITGETSRKYEPEVRFFEVEDQKTHERFNVATQSGDRHFAVMLPPGEYRLNRVQISEGPFLSMADLTPSFTVGNSPFTYLGTWRFGVDSSRYGRMVAVSMALDQHEVGQALQFLDEQYPGLNKSSMVEMLPQPSQTEARLYEVMPYPRYPGYFRRHHW